MKLKGISLPDDKLMLLGALGLMVYGAIPAYDAATIQASAAVYDENGNVISEAKPQKNYIKKAADILSYNDYRPIKTLYKLQNVMQDIDSITAFDAVSTSASENFGDIFNQIRPFLNDTKLNTVNDLMNNVNRTKKTIQQVSGIKKKISSLPKETPKSERLKTLIEEIPTISGIPVLENVNNIKNILGMLKPPAPSDTETSSETGGEKAEYDDIFDLVEMLDKKDAG